jgi:D-glycero-D-manno-heptose 1,7-bisphosphate phosphatase
MAPAVFFDRDDTLIACNELPAPPPPAALGDLIDPALVRLLPGVREGLIALRAAGYTLVVVSNQGVVARGGATCETVERVNARVSDLLRDDQGQPLIERFYFCPYHPKGNIPDFTRDHPWRKPAPGMILAAATDLKLDLTRSWLIGDAERDVVAGVAAGLSPERCFRIGPGTPRPSLQDAANIILNRGAAK